MTESRFDTGSLMAKALLLVPTLLAFFLLLYFIALMHKPSANAWAFTSDGAYFDLAVARTLSGQGFLGLGETGRIPATSDTLWQLVLSAVQSMVSNPVAAPVLLSCVMAVWLLFKVRTWPLLVRPESPLLPILLMVAVSSSLAADVLGGRSMVVASVLTLLMLVSYAEGMPRERWPLSPLAAWWAGLAMLVRVEMLVIWLALVVHALAIGHFREGRGQGIVFPLCRFVVGLLVVGLVLTPAIAWNLSLLANPWPRFPDAPMSLDAWSTQPPGLTFATSLKLSLSAMWGSYFRAFTVPILRGFLPLAFMLVGLVVSLQEARRDHTRLVGTLGLALLLVPLLFALIYPYVGWGAADHVFRALQPAWAVWIALGVVYTADFLGQRLSPSAKKEMPWLTPQGMAVGLFTLLILSGFGLNLATGRDDARQLARQQSLRDRVNNELGPVQEHQVVASDRIGWMAYTRGGRFLDLTGRVTPIMLAYRSQAGWQGGQAAGYLRQKGVTHLVLFAEEYAYAESALTGQALSGNLPRVSRVR